MVFLLGVDQRGDDVSRRTCLVRSPEATRADLPSSNRTYLDKSPKMDDLQAPPSKRARTSANARADLPSKLIDVILSKCDAREQLLITGLCRNLRERPVRALIFSALEMSRTWPPMTSRGAFGSASCSDAHLVESSCEFGPDVQICSGHPSSDTSIWSLWTSSGDWKIAGAVTSWPSGQTAVCQT